MKKTAFVLALLTILAVGAYPLMNQVQASNPTCDAWCIENYSGSPLVLEQCKQQCCANGCAEYCSLYPQYFDWCMELCTWQ